MVDNLYISYIPNRRDNKKQVILKLFFLIALIVFIGSAVYLTNYFLTAKKQDSIIDESRKLWHSSSSQSAGTAAPSTSITDLMLAENSDFKGWITVPNTKVDNPIYQTDNNDYYLTHNQKKQTIAYVALFFDCENIITEEETDKNLVIYGHHMKNGSMFANLTKYRNLDFYKQNPTLEFSTLYKNFLDDDDFNSWADEAYQRSLINTGVDVVNGDNIITLVTCVYDFDDARLVVMARETREGEAPTVDTSSASANPSPRYPKRWYDDRGLDFPFD